MQARWSVALSGGRGRFEQKNRTHMHQYLAARAVCTWGRSYCWVPPLAGASLRQVPASPYDEVAMPSRSCARKPRLLLFLGGRLLRNLLRCRRGLLGFLRHVVLVLLGPGEFTRVVDRRARHQANIRLAKLIPHRAVALPLNVERTDDGHDGASHKPRITRRDPATIGAIGS